MKLAGSQALTTIITSSRSHISVESAVIHSSERRGLLGASHSRRQHTPVSHSPVLDVRNEDGWSVWSDLHSIFLGNEVGTNRAFLPVDSWRHKEELGVLYCCILHCQATIREIVGGIIYSLLFFFFEQHAECRQAGVVLGGGYSLLSYLFSIRMQGQHKMNILLCALLLAWARFRVRVNV